MPKRKLLILRHDSLACLPKSGGDWVLSNVAFQMVVFFFISDSKLTRLNLKAVINCLWCPCAVTARNQKKLQYTPKYKQTYDHDQRFFEGINLWYDLCKCMQDNRLSYFFARHYLLLD